MIRTPRSAAGRPSKATTACSAAGGGGGAGGGRCLRWKEGKEKERARERVTSVCGDDILIRIYCDCD